MPLNTIDTDPDGKLKEKIYEELAKMSAAQHFKEAGRCFFSFSFIDAIVEFVWAIQRLFRIGHYSKWGRFTRILNKHK
jgi:hypothetical protein